MENVTQGSSLTVSVGGGTLTHIATGLANGASYRLRVRAHNTSGWGPWSAWSAPATPQPPPPPPDTFVDDDDSVFEQDIEWLAAEGVTLGCNPPANDRYCPDAAVTRGQMAAFLARALDLPPDNSDWFTDDDGTVFEADIERLRAAGITQGCNPPTNDRFCPGRQVSRAEMASFLSRALGLAEVAVAPRPHSIDVVPREAWGAAGPQGIFESHEVEQIIDGGGRRVRGGGDHAPGDHARGHGGGR